LTPTVLRCNFGTFTIQLTDLASGSSGRRFCSRFLNILAIDRPNMFETNQSEINATPVDEAEFLDISIKCIDCSESFVFTSGEQAFFRDKGLLNPPKRCKECKKAKTKRIDAIETGRLLGKRQRIDVRAKCAQCETITTVPFYPSQGRPVYCRDCFNAHSSARSNSAATGI